jgi:S1-C subfamily serine protease
MIKIDLPGGLKAVTLKDATDEVSPGQRILIMGYPGASPDVLVGRASVDGFNRQTQVFTVPSPTASDGSIGRVISMFGDYYQLSGSSPGPGNSGGPIFNKDGHVIGIYTAGNAQGMSFAVPIKYGMDLMNPNRRTFVQ